MTLAVFLLGWLMLTVTGTTCEPGAVIADGVATGVIRDDDAPPFVHVFAINPQEGDEEGDGDPNLPATGAESVSVTERVATGAPCDAGGDFEPFTDRVVMFAPGQTSATSDVVVCGDTEPERSERFRVRAVAGSNVQLGDAELNVIGDNDPEPPAEP